MKDDQTIKSRLRNTVLAIRDGLPNSQRVLESAQACRKLNVLVKTLQAHHPRGQCGIALYSPMRSELDCSGSFEPLTAEGHLLCLPRMQDTGSLHFHKWRPGQVLEKGSFGTLEPSMSFPVIDPDIIVLPLSCFDRACNRSGYGKGCYDRTISNMRDSGLQPFLIGVAFPCQEISMVPMEHHDIPLDYIVTAKSVHQRNV
ncbi:MAG: 5-formyltetrahydrofolate cyclo-ligase [Cohaesibacteraceae bacterium]|nr:5-formyltetrahydrofolate cyclo-ligase [Cohaesibacteraceae bacterium]MBL4876998.1 5-formyltetrahydrofolate cyclo-ligase [Cohaesibacteraceae bacterium]